METPPATPQRRPSTLPSMKTAPSTGVSEIHPATPTRSKSPVRVIRFPALHSDEESADEQETDVLIARVASGEAGEGERPVVVVNAPPEDPRAIGRRGRSGTMGSVAEFAQRRPASLLSIILGILLAVSLVLAVIGLIMLIFVVNKGGFLLRETNASSADQTRFRTWWTGPSPIFDKLSGVFYPDTEDVSTLASPASGLVGAGSTSAGESTVFVVKTSRIHASRPAGFGPHIEEADGRIGWLIPLETVILGQDPDSTDPDRLERIRRGCPPEDNALEKPILAPPKQGWVAVIERGSCPFATKVRYVQSLGASAAIVGDWDETNSLDVAASSSPQVFADSWDWDLVAAPLEEDEDALAGFGSGLITMYAPGDTSDIDIPSVFVARDSYVSLKKDWLEEATVAPDDGQDAERLEKARALQIVMSRDEVWSWSVPPFRS